MKKNLVTVSIVLLTLTLLMSVAFSAAHRVEILRAATVNGVELKPGNYQLTKTDESTAEIYKGKRLVVTAEVEVVPLGNATPGSVSQGVDGKVREIRLKQEKVVFVASASGTRSGS